MEDCALTCVNGYIPMVIYFRDQPEEWAYVIWGGHEYMLSGGQFLVNCSHLSPCSFLKSFSDMATGKSSSPTGGWMLTLKQSSLVLRKKHIKADEMLNK